MLPYLALNAVTSNQSSAAHDLEQILGTHALVVELTGSPVTYRVDLEGSLDGVTWFVLVGAKEDVTPHGPDRQFIEGRPVRYVRATLSNLTGGSSPTVTAMIASA